MSKELYTTTVAVTGGRDGRAVSQDGLLDVPMAFPKELGGPGGAVNPETLFAAGFGGCFASSVKFSAQAMKMSVGTVTVDAFITLFIKEDGSYGLKARLETHVPGVTGTDLERLIAEAKRVCAYTNATKGAMEVSVVTK
jgi:osmotically inducible protein OsmC